MRFYMTRTLAEAPGDQSNNFSFVAFLPVGIKPYVEPVVTNLHYYAASLGIIPNFGAGTTGTMLDKTTDYERRK